jgi:hypothetical protein
LRKNSTSFFSEFGKSPLPEPENMQQNIPFSFFAFEGIFEQKKNSFVVLYLYYWKGGTLSGMLHCVLVFG